MMSGKRLMWVLSPAFMMACVLEALVFGMVDPQGLYWFGTHVEMSRQAVYALAFFAFWSICACGGALTILLSIEPDEINTAAPQGGRDHST